MSYKKEVISNCVIEDLREKYILWYSGLGNDKRHISSAGSTVLLQGLWK